ncbi:MAG: polyphosphate:AMP phosphotransferase [Bacteroidia bacterium]|jgi:polyphosphate:AMP phosphotransferase
MFESLPQGPTIKNGEYEERAETLRHELLQAQFALDDSQCPTLLVIGGVDGAGKGALVHRLTEWMDARGIETSTYWMHSDEEVSRPYFWRFWRKLPKRGSIGIFLGSWYHGPTQLAIDGMLDDCDLAKQGEQLRFFEDMLTDDGALIIKLWLHIDRKTQKLQLTERAGKQQNPRVTDRPYEIRGGFDEHLTVASSLLGATSSKRNPWHLIDATTRNHRELAAGDLILTAMQARLAALPDKDTSVAKKPSTAKKHKRLASVDLEQRIKRSDYKKQLKHWQAKLQDLAWQAYSDERPVVALFEGWDAAGKGSAIRRVTSAIDPRLFQLVQIAAPSDEELAHHYLWRFWRKLERDGRCTFFDRSWYGRVLVERVEGFATTNEWMRAYDEINDFEQQLVSHGCIVLKFWLHISKDEQLARFEARQEEPRKQHKITDDDWRNRKKWPAYEAAVEDMLQQTDTSIAPWTVIAGNNKRYARVEILKTFCDTLSAALENTADK